MHELFHPFVSDVTLTGNIQQDVVTVLLHHGYARIAGHVARVAAEARRLAARFGVDEAQAATAAWLHDVGAVVANGQRAAICHAFAIEVLPEEEDAPFILHQKLSALMAREIWAIQDDATLSAIACHTTLKTDASLVDKVVFVADKIQWDQPGEPPYLEALLATLDHSLDAAAFCYLDHLWQQRDRLQVIHPWLVAAYRELALRFPR
ncbi:MAG TPA: HD domain-containing protein [Anaerolineae bacterium]